MEIVLASRNKKKIAELTSLLSHTLPGIIVLSLDDVGIKDEIEENGETFEENSMIKASVPAKLGYISIADDSGLCVDALGGEPGVYSARYSGGDDSDNVAFLLSKLENIPYPERTARFVCCVTCVFPEQKVSFSVRGECEGYIVTERRGENGFGYDPVFYYPPFCKTFAEVGADKKEAVSHRGRAMRLFAERFAEKVKEYGLK